MSGLFGRARVVSTDPNKSNSGFMFAGLTASLLSGDVIALESLGRIDGDVATVFRRMGYKPPSSGKLFDDYVAAERDYHRRTRMFPIMHTVVVRRDVYRAHRWMAQSLCKAFAEAKRRARADLLVTNALSSMLPWQIAQVEEARRELGDDWWPYGLEPNRAVLDTFPRYHHEQGLSKRRLAPEELFAPETHEAFRI